MVYPVQSYRRPQRHALCPVWKTAISKQPLRLIVARLGQRASSIGPPVYPIARRLLRREDRPA